MFHDYIGIGRLGSMLQPLAWAVNGKTSSRKSLIGVTVLFTVLAVAFNNPIDYSRPVNSPGDSSETNIVVRA
jgi:hypothetical protein